MPEFDEVTFIFTIFGGIICTSGLIICMRELYHFLMTNKLNDIWDYKAIYVSSMITIFCWTVTGGLTFGQMISKLKHNYPFNSDEGKLTILTIIQFNFYGLSMLLTLGIYILRIYITFIGSHFEYKKRSLNLLKCFWCFILSWVLFSEIYALNQINGQTSNIEMLFIWLVPVGLMLTLIILLFYMLISRLIRLSNMEHNRDNMLLKNVISKIMNLYSFNVISSVLVIAFSFIPVTTHQYGVICFDIMLCLDSSYLYISVYISF